MITYKCKKKAQPQAVGLRMFMIVVAATN